MNIESNQGQAEQTEPALAVSAARVE